MTYVVGQSKERSGKPSPLTGSTPSEGRAVFGGKVKTSLFGVNFQGRVTAVLPHTGVSVSS